MAPPKQERQDFWKNSYARSSFVETLMLLEWLRRENPAFNSELRRTLSVAITTLYGRPFKQRKAVRLSEDVVPIEYRQSHSEIIEARDKFIAHRDLDAPVANWGFTNQVQLAVDSEGLFIHTLTPNIEDPLVKSLLELVKILIPKLDALAQQFLQKYVVPLPPPGRYTVNVHDENPERWLKLEG